MEDRSSRPESEPDEKGEAMSYITQTSKRLFVLSSIAVACALPGKLFAGDERCNFKATETTEAHVLADGKTLWAGPIEKTQTKTVSVPEGPFTVISKVYNQNMKAKEDVRAQMHTRQCKDDAVLALPLFQDPKGR